MVTSHGHFAWVRHKRRNTRHNTYVPRSPDSMRAFRVRHQTTTECGVQPGGTTTGNVCRSTFHGTAGRHRRGVGKRPMPCLERAHAEREAEQVRRLAVVEKSALVDGRLADEHGDDDDDTITVSRVGYSPNAATASSGPMITSRFISIATCVAGMCRVANTLERPPVVGGHARQRASRSKGPGGHSHGRWDVLG